MFILNGLWPSGWFPFVALVAATLELTPAELGLALFGIPVSLLAGVWVSHALEPRLGTRRVMAVGLTVLCPSQLFPALASFVLPGVPGSHWWLALSLMPAGFGLGLLDPAQHHEVNKASKAMGRELIGYFTGLNALAALGQASVAPIAIWAGASPLAYLGGAAAVSTIAAAIVIPRLLRAAPLPAYHEGGSRGPIGRWWLWVVALSALAVAGFASEGIWADWHGVFLTGSGIGASFGAAAVGYFAFQHCSVSARFANPRLVERFGPARILSVSIGVAGGGAVLIVTAQSLAMGLVGAALLGAGIVPIALAAAGVHRLAVTIVTGVGTFMMMLVPPAIGFLAEVVGVRNALWTIICLLVMAALTTWTVRSRSGAGGESAEGALA